jgi:flavin reductase (DIM6/NTAB) family NADH-FMN oxidoreductase RutF
MDCRVEPGNDAAKSPDEDPPMHYDVSKKNHGLPHDPFKAIVAPRPIGWITSMSAAGEINLAPYSWFNGVSSAPPMVMFSSELRKDTLTFIEETKEFVCNFATWELREQVNLSSAPFPRGVNEMEKCGLEPAPSRFVKPPRVAASPCALECKWLQTVSLADVEGRPTDRHVVFGQVIGVYIDERFIRDGLLDTAALQPIMRAGYHDYFGISPVGRFTMKRPAGGGNQS